MITIVNHKIIECDICKQAEDFPASMSTPDGWWKINFNKVGITYHTFDMCPNCTDKVKKYIESIEMERF